MSEASEDIEAEGLQRRARRRRRRRRIALALGGVTMVFGAIVLVQAWVPMGRQARGERLARMQDSPQWQGDKFENPQPLWNDALGMFTQMASASDVSSPSEALPVVRGGAERFATPPPTGLRVTWLGHSTLLIEIDGHRFLTDPVWGPRTAPLTWLGPARWYPPPLDLDELPELDAVLISHDHYDHLDHPTIAAMVERLEGGEWDVVFYMPLGVGAHLEYWGVPSDRIIELDWWDTAQVGDLELACVPSRHASGRQIFDQNETLWSGWVLRGTDHRVYFSGDTGLFPAMAEIGERFGPFDLTMIEAGAYNKAWPDWHIGPEQAVRAHQMVRGEVFLPIHWGLFDLAYHGWTEPIERSVAAAEAAGVTIVTPRPGASFEPEDLGPQERWWPDVPWRRASEDPIVSTGVD